jgi:hypothetical protein
MEELYNVVKDMTDPKRLQEQALAMASQYTEMEDMLVPAPRSIAVSSLLTSTLIRSFFVFNNRYFIHFLLLVFVAYCAANVDCCFTRLHT